MRGCPAGVLGGAGSGRNLRVFALLRQRVCCRGESAKIRITGRCVRSAGQGDWSERMAIHRLGALKSALGR
jgi:hypothetical protein